MRVASASLSMMMAMITALCTAPLSRAQAAVSAEISEVVTGLYAAPTAQYVVIRVTSDGDMTCNDAYSPASCYSLVSFDNSNPPIATSIDIDFDYGNSAGSYYDPNNLPRISHVKRGDRIFIANTEAAQFFNIAPDFLMPSQGQTISSAGVLVLFNNSGGVDDEFSTGAAGQSDQVNLPSGGTFSHASVYAFNPSAGLLRGMAAQRFQYTSVNTGSTVNNSRYDFLLASNPWPESLVGVTATINATCGNNTMEGFEQCDDGAGNGTDGVCSNTCQLVPNFATCGNGTLETGEQCDDGNLLNGDGCSYTCRWENRALRALPTCGNGILELGESCDPPVSGICDASCHFPACGTGYNGTCSTSSDTCVSGTCTSITSVCSGANTTGQCPGGQTCNAQGKCVSVQYCGDGSVEAGEQCDHGSTNGQSGDTCTSTCRLTASFTPTCGNDAVEFGEQCDAGAHQTASISGQTVVTNRGNDPSNANYFMPNSQQTYSGCSQTCQVATEYYWKCGDGFVDPGEACDDGSQNGAANDLCAANCTWVTPPQNAVNPNTGVSGGSTGGATTAGTTTSGSAGGSTTSSGTGTTSAGSMTTTGGATAGGTNTGGLTTGSTSTHSEPTTTSSTSTGGSVTEQGGIGCAAMTPDAIALLGVLGGVLAWLRRPRPVPVPIPVRKPKSPRR